MFVTEETTETFDELRDLIEAGHVRSVIDSEHPVERAGGGVALVKDGRPAGRVVAAVVA